MRKPMRVFDLLGVLSKLKACGVTFTFDLVGDGPDLEEWVQEARGCGLSERQVVVHGRVSASEAARMIGDSDICVSVAEQEGAGMACIQAMGAGVVVCATDTGSGASRLITDGLDGILVGVGEIEQLADRIAALSNIPLTRASMGKAACQRVRRAGLTADLEAKAYAEVFRDVLSSPLRPWRADEGLMLNENQRSCGWDARDLEQYTRGVLRQAGCNVVVPGEQVPGCDAVVVREGDRRPSAQQISEWRAQGISVVILPRLCLDTISDRVVNESKELVRCGCQRIVVAPHPGRLDVIRSAMAAAGEKIIGVLDFDAHAGDTVYGIPAQTTDRWLGKLHPDALLVIDTYATGDQAYEQIAEWTSAITHECDLAREHGLAVMWVTQESNRQAGAEALRSVN